MTLSVAIIGAGIGEQHLQAYLKLPSDFSILYVVDRDVERAHGICGDFDIKVAAEIETAMSDPAVDIIDICLPPPLHVPVALQALAANKHVICEKPLATSMHDVDLLRQASAKSGKNVYPVFQYRWGPALAQLRYLMKMGLTGQPQVASLETHWSRGADYYAVPWRGTWDGEQGGAVLCHAIHNHDLLTQFMGPVRSLSAMTTTRINDIETEDCAAISFEMTNGAVATSSITLGAGRDETRLRLVFSELTATSGSEPYAPGLDQWTFTARKPETQLIIDEALRSAPIEPVGFAGFFTAIATAEKGETNTAVSLNDGAASIELVTAIYHAARTGHRIALPLSQSNPLYKGWQP